MQMSDHDFDMDEWMDEMEERIENAVTNAAETVVNDLLEDRLDDMVRDTLQEVLPEAVGECLANFEFVMKDGAVVQPRQRLRVLSPDGSKLLECYGGLKVDGTSLLIQTRVSCWESIAAYPDRDAAIAALQQVLAAMEAGEQLLRLS
jgi:hypothetical protein